MTNATMLEHRKAEILRLGQQAVAQRGARRRARRHAVVMLALTTGVTVLAVTLAPRPIAPSMPTPRPIATSPAPTPAITITRVATTAGLAGSLAVEPTPSVARVQPDTTRIARVTAPQSPAERLTDTQALALLKEAGTPAGLIKIEGRVMLVYHERPEEPLGPSGLAPTHDGGTLAVLTPYRPM